MLSKYEYWIGAALRPVAQRKQFHFPDFRDIDARHRNRRCGTDRGAVCRQWIRKRIAGPAAGHVGACDD